MPHIFPRRFLRDRDLLDPTDLNDDVQPAHDLVTGNLDRTNFDAQSLKVKLRPGPNSTLPAAEGPHVAEGAYFNVHCSQIESRPPLYDMAAYEFRNPPNFVKLDGTTFRRDAPGTDADAKPFVVPNNGAWTAVENADLSAAQQITFASGETKVWISAYAQYVWQGFFEPKSPYVSGTKSYAFNEFVATPDVGATFTDNTWLALHDTELPLAEQMALNVFGPSSTWEALPRSDTRNLISNLRVYDESYAWPLNECESAAQERYEPNFQGYHHISRGFYPCLVQFALRVDGKILEETITGKRLPFEETSHGLLATDSPPIKSKADRQLQLIQQLYGSTDATDPDGDDFWLDTLFGQKTIHSTSNFEADSPEIVPGQTLKSSRAVACGPEVMPVRLGAVVSLTPGNHTIELVVRRLERKSDPYGEGDYVGVFSRRLLAFECPVRGLRQSTDDSSPLSVMATLDRLDVPNFLTEDVVDEERVVVPRKRVAAQLNEVTSDDLRANVLSNEYLPSKVTFSQTTNLITSFKIDEYTGEYTNLTDSLTSQAVFPGWATVSLKNNVIESPRKGWQHAKVSGFDSDTVGWFKLTDGSQPLEIVDTTGDAKIQPGEKMILFMDLELRNIKPIYSQAAKSLRNSLKTLSGADLTVREHYNNFVQYMLAERYLDLFALAAIGYKQDGAWNIMGDVCPAMVNNFNWTNRGPLFTCNANDVPTMTTELNLKHWWEADLGWNEGGVSRWDTSSWYKLLRNRSVVVVGGVGSIEVANESKYVSDGRGDRLFPSNLGINIPIMQVIENTGTTEMNVTEFAGFVSTYLPSTWCQGVSPSSPRYYESPDGDLPLKMVNQWASPMGGRDMLDGIRIRWGQARLTAIKVTP